MVNRNLNFEKKNCRALTVLNIIGLIVRGKGKVVLQEDQSTTTFSFSLLLGDTEMKFLIDGGPGYLSTESLNARLSSQV